MGKRESATKWAAPTGAVCFTEKRLSYQAKLWKGRKGGERFSRSKFLVKRDSVLTDHAGTGMRRREAKESAGTSTQANRRRLVAVEVELNYRRLWQKRRIEKLKRSRE